MSQDLFGFVYWGGELKWKENLIVSAGASYFLCGQK